MAARYNLTVIRTCPNGTGDYIIDYAGNHSDDLVYRKYFEIL